jgi:hypothetical protein
MPKQEQPKPYSVEKAEEEAGKIQKKIRGGYARDYPEAERLVERDYRAYDFLDERKAEIVESIKRNEPIISLLHSKFEEEEYAKPKFIAASDDEGRVYIIAMPREIFHYHADIEIWLNNFIAGRLSVKGGGYIQINETEKKIIVSGKSSSFGKENREETYLSLRNNFPEYQIEIEGVDSGKALGLEEEIDSYRKNVVKQIALKRTQKEEMEKRRKAMKAEEKIRAEYLEKERREIIELMENNPESIFEAIESFKKQQKDIYDAFQDIIESSKNPEITAFIIGKSTRFGHLGEYQRPKEYGDQKGELKKTLNALSDLSGKVNLAVDLYEESKDSIIRNRFNRILESIENFSRENRFNVIDWIFSEDVNLSDHQIGGKLHREAGHMRLGKNTNSTSNFINHYLNMRYKESDLRHILSEDQFSEITEIKDEIKQTLKTLNDLSYKMPSFYPINIYCNPSTFTETLPVEAKAALADKLASLKKYDEALKLVKFEENIPQETKIAYFENMLLEKLSGDSHLWQEGDRVTVFYDSYEAPTCSGCRYVERLLKDNRDIGVEIKSLWEPPGVPRYKWGYTFTRKK